MALVDRQAKGAHPFPDLIGRDFTSAGINQKWSGDLTEIPTDEGKRFLAAVEDLASRRVPGFAMGEHHDAELAAGSRLGDLCIGQSVGPKACPQR